ncbi:MAG TPA: hypothetical protein VJ277_10545, partial [Gemmatimonadales bacterium]|nr:hypothetical protein [Gemmatimonadales bacterium]
LFISAAIAFIITASVLYFLVVVPMAKVQNRFTAKEEEKKADIKAALRDCPRCYTEIPAIATRCAHCTSDVEPDPQARKLAGLPAQR